MSNFELRRESVNLDRSKRLLRVESKSLSFCKCILFVYMLPCWSTKFDILHRFTYAIITLFFALSYSGRFYLNVSDKCGEVVTTDQFAIQMVYVIVYLLEGASMGVLMMFHIVNFKNGSLLTSSEELTYASISLDEFLCTSENDDEVVDAEDMTIQSDCEIEDRGGVDHQLPGSNEAAEKEQALINRSQCDSSIGQYDDQINIFDRN